MSGEQSTSDGRARWIVPGAGVRWMALIALALGLRLAGIHRTSLWSDEAFTLLAADMPWADLLGRFPWVESNPPLHFVLVKLWGTVSESVLWHRLLSVLIGLIGVVFITCWIRLFDRRAGWMAGALAAVCPMFIHYSQEIRGYILLYTATTAAFYLAELDIRSRSRIGMLWPVAVAVAAWSHFVGMLVAAAVVLYWFSRRWQVGCRIPWPLRLSVLLFLTAPFGILLWNQGSAKHDEGFWIARPDGAYVQSTLEEMVGVRWAERWRGDPAPTWREVAVIAWRGALELSLFGALLLLVGARPGVRHPALAIALIGILLFVFMLTISLWLFPILLSRTGAVLLVPLIGLLSLSTNPCSWPSFRRVGTSLCSVIVLAWGTLWISVQAEGLTLRSPDSVLFGYVRDRMNPSDHVACFPDSLAWSAGWMLRDRLDGDRLHTRRVSSFTGQNPLRMLPLPERRDPEWMRRITATLAKDLSGPNPGSVWIVDGGFDARMDLERQQLIDWLRDRYQAGESAVVDGEWGLAASRFVPCMEPQPEVGAGS